MKALLSIYLSGVALLCHSQDLESIAKGNILKGGGAFSVNQIYNHSKGKLPSRNPYSYVVNGNLNLQILGFINAPFNFLYSNLGNQFTQPTFNQTSLHPHYKWVSTHFGSISCNYSSYTVNGHLFQGAAIDLTPGNFSFSTFYGRFKKAVQPGEEAIGSNIVPVYKRIGGGCKIGFKSTQAGNWSLVLFSAKDQLNSIIIPANTEPVIPQQNWSSSVQGEKNLLKKLRISSELSYSMLTENLLVKEHNQGLPSFLRFYNTNASTQLFKAVKAGLTYAVNKGNLNISYQRIDPFYRTLGAYYFTNDLESLTAGFSTSMLKRKVNISTNAGLQHDNLNRSRLSTMKRFAGNTTLSIRPNTKMNINVNYSNFLSYTNVRPYTDPLNQINPSLNWDTLNFRQISQNISSSIFMLLHSDSIFSSSVTHSLTYQKAADRQHEDQHNNAFFNANIGYSYSKTRTGASLILSLNAGQTMAAEKQLINLSPVVNISKPFFNRTLRPALSFNYTCSYYDKVRSGGVANLRGMVNYTMQKIHQFSLSFQLLRRKDAPVTSLYTYTPHSTETTISLAYSVNMDFFDIKRPLKNTPTIQ